MTWVNETISCFIHVVVLICFKYLRQGRIFRVKNHNFTPKNHIFSNFRGARLDPPLYGIVYSSQRAVCDATEQCTGVGGVGFVVDGG